MGKPVLAIVAVLAVSLVIVGYMLWESGTHGRETIIDIDVMPAKIADLKENR